MNHSPLRKLSVKINTDGLQKKTKSKKNDDKGENIQVELDSPTSVTLQNSFLIKNANSVFDGYHKAI